MTPHQFALDASRSGQVPSRDPAAPGALDLIDVLRRVRQNTACQWRTAVSPAITMTHFLVLQAVSARPGGSQNDLCDALGTSPSTIGTAVTHLVTRAVLERRGGSPRGQAVSVTLTPAGQALYDQLVPAAEAFAAALVARVPEQQRRTVLQALHTIATTDLIPTVPGELVILSYPATRTVPVRGPSATSEAITAGTEALHFRMEPADAAPRRSNRDIARRAASLDATLLGLRPGLDATLLACILAGWASPERPLTRADALELAAHTLGTTGDSVIRAWADRVDPAERAVRWLRAVRCIHRSFATLTGASDLPADPLRQDTSGALPHSSPPSQPCAPAAGGHDAHGTLDRHDP
ncbi:MarR family winged helix-turn-helix transcriptional regulator [Saccharothrix sp. AJ9571]|nr:MarR family winged helix-turn-helix transcriptional regulator [Saccharothrix sp. AJ9571]